MTKQDFLEIVQTLPEDTPFDKLAVEVEKIRFMDSVDRGLKQADEGNMISHEELVAKFNKRFKG